MKFYIRKKDLYKECHQLGLLTQTIKQSCVEKYYPTLSFNGKVASTKMIFLPFTLRHGLNF